MPVNSPSLTMSEMLEKAALEGDILGVRRMLLGAVEDLVDTRQGRVRLSEALLRADPTKHAHVEEVTSLLAFADLDDAMRGDGTGLWPYEAMMIKGQMYRGLCRFEDAIAAFSKAYNWCPNKQAAAEMLSGVLRDAGHTQKAADILAEFQGLADNRIDKLPVWKLRERTKPNNASRYLDLLEKTVCNWIYGDDSHPSCGDTAFDRTRRAVGRDLPVIAHSMIGLKRLQHLRWAMETVLTEKIAGDCIEAGVWRGGACILMRGVLAARNDKQRRVFVADSFSGLPPPDTRFEKDLATLHAWHTRTELAISLESVKQNFASYDLLDEQVIFVPGFFNDTLAKIDAAKFSILRLDGDMYSSTLDTLDALYDRVSPGGFVICDDYGVLLDAQRAILDFRKKYNISAPMFSVDGDAVFWRK